MKKIRFGILGSGYMGRTHAEAIKQLGDRAALTAISGGRRAAGLAQQYGIAEEPTAEALIRRADVDAVIVTTPHHVHADATVYALQQGKHAMVEKPLATTVEDCDRMMAAATAGQRVLAVGYQQRFRPNNLEAWRLIRAGAIGKVETVQSNMAAQRVEGVSSFGSDWQWWNDPASIGHLINALPHAIDQIRWWTGADITTVSAFCRTLLPDIKVEDTTMALAGFSNGTIATLYSSRALPHANFDTESFRFRVVGSDGLIDLDSYEQLRLADAKGWRVMSTQPKVGHLNADTAFLESRMQAYRDQMTSFIAAINGEPTPAGAPQVGSAGDGRAAVAACCAIVASSQQRRWIDLPAGRGGQ
jgi:predicted dehydrogenase